MAVTVYKSFFRISILDPEHVRFNGLGNYLALLTDSRFRQDLVQTLVFALVSVTLEVVLGTVMALAVHRGAARRAVAAGAGPKAWSRQPGCCLAARACAPASPCRFIQMFTSGRRYGTIRSRQVEHVYDPARWREE